VLAIALKSKRLLQESPGFNNQQFYVVPTQCIYAFCMDMRTNSDRFSILHKLTSFITETERVYCAVRTGSYSIIHVNVSLQFQ
jgi:hypothetical protein